MSNIEIGSKWVKDGEVVEVCDIHNAITVKICSDGSYTGFNIVFFRDSNFSHCLRESDFLKQYKPYKPVYEYQYAIKIGTGMGNILKIDNLTYYSDEYKHSISGAYYTDNEKKPKHWVSYQRLDFTKRERKQ